MYTKKMSDQNKRIEAAAKSLLTECGNHTVTVEKLLEEFPTVTVDRMRRRVDKAARELHGLEVRRRNRPGAGPPFGNQNASKDVSKEMWSARFDKEIKKLIKVKAAKRKMSQTDYVAWLVKQDKI